MLKTFFTHIQTHNTPTNIKCVKCGERPKKGTLPKHLTQCHGFGIYQCVYCRFGTNTFEMISSHLANQHPSSLPMFCKRSGIAKESTGEQADAGNNSIDSTSLKRINQEVNPIFKKKAPSAGNRQTNLVSMGCLGPNVYVKGLTVNESRLVKAGSDVQTTSSNCTDRVDSLTGSSKSFKVQYEQPFLMESPPLKVIATSRSRGINRNPNSFAFKNNQHNFKFAKLPTANFKVRRRISTGPYNDCRKFIISKPLAKESFATPAADIARNSPSSSTVSSLTASSSKVSLSPELTPTKESSGLFIQNVFSVTSEEFKNI